MRVFGVTEKFVRLVQYMYESRLTDEARQESVWTMMFADYIVICSESRKQVEEILERWSMRWKEVEGKSVIPNGVNVCE